MFDLTNQSILISGGYGYLGAAMARGVAERGARVFVLGRHQAKFDDHFADDPRLSFVRCDLASSASIRAAFEQVYSLHGSLDVLVNNGMYFRGNDPMNISDEDWNFSIDGALSSVYRCIREAGPFLERQQSGNIITISSMYGMVSPDFRVYEAAPASFNPPQYGAAKAALIQLTKYFANLLGPLNVRVNAISPGPFPNTMVQKNQNFMRDLAVRTALGRIGRPEELVGALVFLASPASTYVTGHNLVVDGGWTSR
jgi:gluconate 5-dehydrogenase